MSTALSELLQIVVNDLCGQLSSTIFSTLLSYGRTPLGRLAQNCDLAPRLVKSGLSALIQQSLAFHYTDPKDDITYYEADWKSAYAVLRSAKALKLIEQRFGIKARGLVTTIHNLGHAPVKELAEAVGKKQVALATSGGARTNGDVLDNGEIGNDGNNDKSDATIKSIQEFHATLYELNRAGYLVTISAYNFQPPADFDVEAELTIAAKPGSSLKGKQAKALFAHDLASLKRKRRDGEDDSSVVTVTSSKKVRTNGDLTNGVNGDHHVSGEPEIYHRLDDTTTVRLSHEKTNVALRSHHLVHLAARHLGETTSKVYDALLQVLEQKIRRCYDELGELDEDDTSYEGEAVASSEDVLDLLPPKMDLSPGISKTARQPNGVDGDGDITMEITQIQDLSQPSSDPKVRLIQVERHLRLLLADPREFVFWAGTGGGGQWMVDFPKLSKYLLQQEIEDQIITRLGSQHVRIVRILNEHGRLDEKLLSHYAMIKVKDLRPLLQELHKLGFVETQEVPKDNSRQPNRSLFLWAYEKDHVKEHLLNFTYKCMSRILQRLKAEKDQNKWLIEKASRTDVVGNEDRFLTPSERQMLKAWRAKEAKFLAQMERQDDIVAVLRDFLPDTTP
ncbi:hypothetical protein NA57DRAFT_57955 [Rhizodiscina lignyota]|uniref:DNA-directed RNA polymerase III subunit RPC3 n=1 Tax=Rhizodiscina lignyota TaxID=1504668 RepID=A0A9P4IAY1_9PEZI|nr:hypothetical protein NA57DRAFT_57955 [Rhizodiscina lignyota]